VVSRFGGFADGGARPVRVRRGAWVHVESRQHDPVDPRRSLRSAQTTSSRLLAGFRQVKVKEMCAGKGLHVLAGMRRRTCGHCGGCHVPCCTLYESSARFVCSVCVYHSRF
jgi:hypothetical protein